MYVIRVNPNECQADDLRQLFACQRGARARMLTADDALACVKRASLNGWASVHGGFVANNYRGRAEATACIAVLDADGTVLVGVGRGRTQSRAYADGGASAEDVSVYSQLGGPNWRPNLVARTAATLEWLGGLACGEGV